MCFLYRSLETVMKSYISRLLMLVSWEDKMDRGASDLSVLLKIFFLVIFCNVLLNKVFLKKENAFYMLRKYFYCTQPPNTYTIMEVKRQGHLDTVKEAHIWQLASSRLTWAAVATQFGGGGTLPTDGGATIRAISIGFSRYLLCSGRQREWKSAAAAQEMWTELC